MITQYERLQRWSPLPKAHPEIAKPCLCEHPVVCELECVKCGRWLVVDSFLTGGYDGRSTGV